MRSNTLMELENVINILWEIQDVARSNCGDEGYESISDAISSVQNAWRICKQGQENKLNNYNAPIGNSRKAIKSSANGLPEGSDYYEWVSYDVWGNEEDGWEVNDASRFSDKRIIIHDDLTDLEVLKVLCAEGILNRRYIDDVDVEFLDDYYIELTEKETGKPIGRLEKVQDIESSRKAIKSGNENNWYGIPGIRMIWHGEWSDPELEYDGYVANYWDVENILYGYAQDDGIENPDDDDVFAQYVRDNADEAKSLIQEFGVKE